MGYFEEQFGDYHKEGSSLPEGFSWEEMELGIREKMEGKRRRWAIWWWILLPLLGGTYFWGSDASSLPPATPEASPEKIEQIRVAYANTLPKKSTNRARSNLTDVSFWTLQTSDFTFSYGETGAQESLSSSALRQKGIRLQSLFPAELTALGLSLPNLQPAAANTVPEKQSAFSDILAFSAFIGGGLLDQGFSNNINSPYVSMFPDINFGIEARWEWKKGHAFSASWSYQQMTEEFFFEDRDEFLTEIPNQLIYRRESTLSGNVIGEQYGTALSNSVRYRKERSYNQIQAHLISLGYERIWTIHPKQTLSGGISLHGMFGLQSDGRRLNANGEIQDIEGQLGYTSAGALAGLHIKYSYQIYPDWAIWFRVQGLQSFTNWDPTAESYTYPRIWNAQLGVSYRLEIL
jgi:hypothetical protein